MVEQMLSATVGVQDKRSSQLSGRTSEKQEELEAKTKEK
jgi:hypothetical protein